MPILLSDEEYAQYLKNRPQTPLWQSLEWKRYQEALGREIRLYGLEKDDKENKDDKEYKERATALVIIDRTTFGLSTWNIPRGPLGESPEAIEELLSGIVEEAKKEKCMAVYFSQTNKLTTNNYQLSTRYEQPEATIIMDITKSDDELLASMTQKCRYNVRLAQKKGVTVTESRDVDAFYELLKQTAERDNFTIKPKDHYEKFLETLPGSFLLLAYNQNISTSITSITSTASITSIAALLGLTHDQTGFYYYGASDRAYKALMAPYLLQWEAMRLCRERGCTRYDLLGIASGEMGRGAWGVRDNNDPWGGVTRFKMQFGGEVVTYPPEREVTLRPMAKWMIGWKRRVLG